MDSFLASSDSGVPKDLGDLPKEQFGDLITDHSRFPIGEEKSDISQKFSPEVDLLGDSFTMSSTDTAPDNKLLEKEKEKFDEFFMEVEEKINSQPVTSSTNNLIDVLEPDMFDPKKKSNNEPEKPLFTDSAPFGAGPDEPVHVKDEIESDYMNPYAEVRTAPVQSQKVEEPAAVPAASTKDDIFDDLVSHTKNDQFEEPMFDDSSSSAAVVTAPVVPAPTPVDVPTPAPVVPEPVEVLKPKTPVEPPQEKSKPPPATSPSSTTTSAASNEQCIQAEKIFKKIGLGKLWKKSYRLSPTLCKQNDRGWSVDKENGN